MTATNHMLAGALIATVIREPALALPLAFVSHFVLDALPHYGNGTLKQPRYVIVGDACVALVVLVAILFLSTNERLLMLGCALLAASPDLLWLPAFMYDLRGKLKPLNRVEYLFNRMQWGERSWGFFVEIPFGVILAGTLLTMRFARFI